MSDRIERIPGVSAAAPALGIPFMIAHTALLSVPGTESIPQVSTGGPYVSMVGNDYFAGLGIPLAKGRSFDSRDNAFSAATAIISESCARALWRGETHSAGAPKLADRLSPAPKSSASSATRAVGS
jgi:hypothetical protein